MRDNHQWKAVGIQMQGSRHGPLGAIYLSNILSRRLLTSLSARFCLEQEKSAGEQDPCQLTDPISDMLASRNLGQGMAKSGLLTSARVLVGLGDRFSDCLCCALEFGAGFSCLPADFGLAPIGCYTESKHVNIYSRVRERLIGLRVVGGGGAFLQASKASRLAFEQGAPGA